jgi:hypothetical protein
VTVAQLAVIAIVYASVRVAGWGIAVLRRRARRPDPVDAHAATAPVDPLTQQDVHRYLADIQRYLQEHAE